MRTAAQSTRTGAEREPGADAGEAVEHQLRRPHQRPARRGEAVVHRARVDLLADLVEADFREGVQGERFQENMRRHSGRPAIACATTAPTCSARYASKTASPPSCSSFTMRS